MTTLNATEPVRRRAASASGPIPLSRVVAVELRKMFDTRSGFWLVAGIAIAAALATAAVILFAPDEVLSYGTFAGAVGFPTSIILPIIAILSVTSEWSQRTGLTTFTWLPRRGRVLLAKGIAAVAVGVVSVPLAFAIGAGGNVVSSMVTGAEAVWDVSLVEGLSVVLGKILGLLVGFMLGVLIRSSAGAIVGYFLYSFVLPLLFGFLATTQEWFRDIRRWVDFRETQGALLQGWPAGDEWAHLVASASLWLLLPLTVGLLLVRGSEVT